MQNEIYPMNRPRHKNSQLRMRDERPTMEPVLGMLRRLRLYSLESELIVCVGKNVMNVLLWPEIFKLKLPRNHTKQKTNLPK
jgi:hypothetical protein